MRDNLIVYNGESKVLFTRWASTKKQARNEIMNSSFLAQINHVTFKNRHYPFLEVFRTWPIAVNQSTNYQDKE